MTVRLLAPARNEIDDAVAWYEGQSSGLGREFLDELDRAVRRALTFPRSSPAIAPGLRRCLLARFSYGVVYGVEQDALIIVAGAHLHRKPRYWSGRLP